MASSANTLTNLIPTLYTALDVVSRELVGFIPAVTRDSSLARAAIGQTVRSFVAPAASASTIAPDRYTPDDGNQTIGNITLAIENARRCPVRWQGEESMQMNSPGGVGVRAIMVDQFAQAMRTLVNEIEADLAGLYVDASRAVAPNATTPFSATLTDAAAVRKILADNGAPLSDMQLVIDTGAGAALRSLAQLNQVNTSGTDSILRQGVLIDLMGMQVRESAQIITPSIGTEANATVNTAAYSAGATSFTLADAGTGTVVDGDLVTFAGDTNIYVANSLVSAVATGTLTIAEPGLKVAIAGSASPAIACRATGTRNMAFSRSAIVLATRMPALPEGGDSAIDRTTITDPRSGLSFEVSMYPQYRQMQYEIAIAWGVKAVKPEHIAILAGV